MSTPVLNPAFVDLNDRLAQLHQEQKALMATGCPPNPNISDYENAILRKNYEETLAAKVKEQLAILATLRTTAAGPAKAGGKRAKKAPIDLEALESSLFE